MVVGEGVGMSVMTGRHCKEQDGRSRTEEGRAFLLIGIWLHVVVRKATTMYRDHFFPPSGHLKLGSVVRLLGISPNRSGLQGQISFETLLSVSHLPVATPSAHLGALVAVHTARRSRPITATTLVGFTSGDGFMVKEADWLLHWQYSVRPSNSQCAQPVEWAALTTKTSLRIIDGLETSYIRATEDGPENTPGRTPRPGPRSRAGFCRGRTRCSRRMFPSGKEAEGATNGMGMWAVRRRCLNLMIASIPLRSIYCTCSTRTF